MGPLRPRLGSYPVNTHTSHLSTLTCAAGHVSVTPYPSQAKTTLWQAHSQGSKCGNRSLSVCSGWCWHLRELWHPPHPTPHTQLVFTEPREVTPFTETEAKAASRLPSLPRAVTAAMRTGYSLQHCISPGFAPRIHSTPTKSVLKVSAFHLQGNGIKRMTIENKKQNKMCPLLLVQSRWGGGWNLGKTFKWSHSNS